MKIFSKSIFSLNFCKFVVQTILLVCMFYLKQFSLNYNCRLVNFSLTQNTLLKELKKFSFYFIVKMQGIASLCHCHKLKFSNPYIFATKSFGPKIFQILNFAISAIRFQSYMDFSSLRKTINYNIFFHTLLSFKFICRFQSYMDKKI